MAASRTTERKRIEAAAHGRANALSANCDIDRPDDYWLFFLFNPAEICLDPR
jgi:hypothetical protein